MKNENPYKVPQGYFQELQEKILQQTTQATTQTLTTPTEYTIIPRKKHTLVKWKAVAAFAGCFIIFVALAYTAISLTPQALKEKIAQQNTTPQNSETNLFAEAVYEYVDLYGLDDETLLDINTQ